MRTFESGRERIFVDPVPDMDGKDVLAALRTWTDAPILVLSARHDEAERIAALDTGADDFVSKPFHIGELQARLRAALRHHARRRQEETEFSTDSLSIQGSNERLCLKVLDQYK